MRATILFVCSANICRSPTAVAVFRRYVHGAGRDGLVTVKSAGVDARPGMEWCTVAREAIGASDLDNLDLGAMRSVPLRTGLLERSMIVLTADGVTSTGVLRMMPKVRGRLFTMVEAATLARLVIGREGGDDEPSMLAGMAVARPESGTNPGLSWLVSEMNAARGQLPTVVPARRRWWQRGEPEAPPVRDIPDAHGTGGAVVHKQMLPLLVNTVESFAESVVHVCTPRTSGRANAG